MTAERALRASFIDLNTWVDETPSAKKTDTGMSVTVGLAVASALMLSSKSAAMLYDSLYPASSSKKLLR